MRSKSRASGTLTELPVKATSGPIELHSSAELRRILRSVPHVVVGAVMLAGALPALAQRADTIIKAASAPRYKGVATLVPELTIGSATGGPEYMFTAVTEIVPG